MNIGIFGCTADPFTIAHYAIVKNAISKGHVDKVIVMPSRVSHHRIGKTPLFSEKSRVDIIEKWFEGDADVIVDTHEFSIPRDENRRYFHMMDYVIGKYTEKYGPSRFYTIIGLDEYENFRNWSRWEYILERTDLIVASRDGRSPEYNGIEFSTLDIGSLYSNVSATSIRDTAFRNNSTVETIKKEYLELVEKYRDSFETEDCILHTPIFNVFRVESKSYGFDPVRVRSKDWVSVIIKKDNRFLTVKQMRYGIGKEMTEFPCGMVEEGEEPIIAAKREVREETGYDIETREFQYLGSDYANPAFMTNRMHYFYVDLDCVLNYAVGDTDLDEHEKLTSEWLELYDIEGKDMSVFMKCAIFRYEDVIG